MDLSIIQSKIYDIMGFKVMLDFDLAEMYMTKAEWEDMSSRFVMISRAKRSKSSTPYAFTEHGVTLSANVLSSDVSMSNYFHQP